MTDPIDYVSLRISRSIKNANKEETNDVEVMDYALALIINMALTTAFILLIGYWIGELKSTAQVLGVFAIQRIIAKGSHLRSLTMCVIVTTALIMLIVLLDISNAIIIPMGAVSVLLISLKSPVILWRKLIACLVVMLVIFTNETSLIMACFFQTITLLPKRR